MFSFDLSYYQTHQRLNEYSRAAIIRAPLDRKSCDTERNTRGRICPVQFSLFNPEIRVLEPERKIRERRVKKTEQTSSRKPDVV